jgi:hypothetical protein
MPLKGLQPLEPDLLQFVWVLKDRCPAGRNLYTVPSVADLLPDMLIPNPALPDPASGFYPVAEPYQLVETDQYRRGLVYQCDFDPKMRDEIAKRCLAPQIPPNIAPREEGDNLVWDPIPGMLELRPGVPMVQRILGPKPRTITVACLQTLFSLQQYPYLYPKIMDLVDDLHIKTFGTPPCNEKPGGRGMYNIPGLKRNDRSARNLPKDSPFGSYNLGLGKIEGYGEGTITTAIQAVDPQLDMIRQILYQLYRLIMPLCISKFEQAMVEWNHADNNVYSFGGPLANGTGCQANVSGDGLLSDMIGLLQGFLHVDRNDHIGANTLLSILLRLPPG